MEYEVQAELPDNLDAFTRGYLECAEWCGIVDEQQRERFRDFPYVNAPRWHRAALKQAREDCATFQEQFPALAEDARRAGHDFYLTRNRHALARATLSLARSGAQCGQCGATRNGVAWFQLAAVQRR